MPATALAAGRTEAIVDATLDRVNPDWRAPRAPRGWRLAHYEHVVNMLREDGPMTAWQLADRLRWPIERAKDGVSRARELQLIARVRKDRDKRFVWGAVQTGGWPLPAPDTRPR
jgi:hypothetical protein